MIILINNPPSSIFVNVITAVLRDTAVTGVHVSKRKQMSQLRNALDLGLWRYYSVMILENRATVILLYLKELQLPGMGKTNILYFSVFGCFIWGLRVSFLIFLLIKRDTVKLDTFEFWYLHISAQEHWIFKIIVSTPILWVHCGEQTQEFWRSDATEPRYEVTKTQKCPFLLRHALGRSVVLIL